MYLAIVLPQYVLSKSEDRLTEKTPVILINYFLLKITHFHE